MLWKHKKRGTTYEVITDLASLQCAWDPDTERKFDGDLWTVYRSVDNGAFYIRMTEEFLDGRFEKIEEGE